MGVLVGTSLIVIIPEGIEAVYTAGSAGHSHTRRSLQERGAVAWPVKAGIAPMFIERRNSGSLRRDAGVLDGRLSAMIARDIVGKDTTTPAPTSPPAEKETTPPADGTHPAEKAKEEYPHEEGKPEAEPPTFYVGLSLVLGFILMFLIDKLPRLASENLQPPHAAREINLQALGRTSSDDVDEESESFLRSMAPTPKQTRSLATTTGLVIHAAADGIAMGASTSTSNQKLGFIIFVAIMIHKAPAAFGLTSVLLKQGLSKRAARGHLVIFSLAAPFGALTTWLLVNIMGGDHIEGERGQWWTGMLLLFSAGTFL